MLWLTFILALAAVASAVVAFVQAKSATDSRKDAETARNESRTARDEAARLAEEANDAFKRQAAAQERANELAEAAIPPKEVQLVIRHVSNQKYGSPRIYGRQFSSP
jgi:uncharacterized protein HemX